MLVGMKDIDSSALKKACKDVETLITYSDSLVPSHFRHIQQIVNNQRYLTAVHVRNLFSNDYNQWKPLCDGLLAGVQITGSVCDLYTCEELINACDTSVMQRFL